MSTFMKCRACNKFTDISLAACEKCGHMETKETNSAPALHIFKSEFYEHIDHDPIYITSKRQLREETRRRGQISDFAE